jgi:hypothetical protein
MTTSADATVEVYVESGSKRVFACSLDWPGLCRFGKDERQALQALAAYVPRYADVAAEAGVSFPASGGVDLKVVERVPGSSGTDFGVPAAQARKDAEAMDSEEAERLTALLEASWRVFDRIVAAAPAELRKGPRGGGRDRDRIVDHVFGAEAGYAPKIGLRLRAPGAHDAAAVAEFRQAIRDRLGRDTGGKPLAERGWPPRYAIRRFAWHVLDHSWEIQDRAPAT